MSDCVWLPRPWDSPGKNTGVGCHFLLQGIFLTQGLNPGLPHGRLMLYPLSHHKRCVKNRPSSFKSREVPPRWMIILAAGASAAKSLQSCPTLCDPIDGSPPGSPILGILQARTLEWAAISFSNAWEWKVKVKSLSRVRLPVTPWTAAHQAPPPLGFSRQEYWSGG